MRFRGKRAAGTAAFMGRQNARSISSSRLLTPTFS